MLNIQAEVTNIEGEFITLRTHGYNNSPEIGKTYNVAFKKYYTTRSLQQNNLMWEIISRIAKETDNDDMDIYTQGLEKANCKAEFLLILPEALESIKKTFRAVKICESREYNGKQMLVVKAYIGSSKYNSDEMTRLIHYFTQLAAELNIFIGDL